MTQQHHVDHVYFDLVQDVLNNGVRKSDRTGTGTISVFGRQARFDLSQGFPILTTKRIHWKSVVAELLWFLRGDTNIKWLNEQGVSIWDEWADQDGNLGPVYGKQWRRWEAVVPVDCELYQPVELAEIDQIKEVIQQIQTNPDSRRLIVSAWNVGEIPQMALAPCHTMFQFYVANGKLSCHLYQRSCDLGLGWPFNVATYSLLTSMVAQVTGLQPGEFVHSFGDLHIYSNHEEALRQQLLRAPYDLPTLKLNSSVKSIDDFQMEDIVLEGYKHHPSIKLPVAV